MPNLVVLRAMSQIGVAPTGRLEALGRQVDDGLKRLYDFQHDGYLVVSLITSENEFQKGIASVLRLAA